MAVFLSYSFCFEKSTKFIMAAGDENGVEGFMADLQTHNLISFTGRLS